MVSESLSRTKSTPAYSCEERETEHRRLQMPLYPPKFITTLRTIRSHMTNRNGFSNYDPVVTSLSGESDMVAGDQSAPSYTVTWSGTQNNTNSELASSEESTLLGEPSPVDWEQW
jgi:hypothetical protein